jgi:hypothetical protein
MPYMICISNPAEGVTQFMSLHMCRLGSIALALTDDANCIWAQLELIISYYSNDIATFNYLRWYH